MNLSKNCYVPSLRWRQAERQALWRLRPEVKDRVVPLITIPPVEFDFELWEPKKSVHEHVHPFVDRFKAKWGQRPAWLALDTTIAEQAMDNGSHIYDYILDGLRSHGAYLVPAVTPIAATGTLAAVRRSIEADDNGIAIMLRLEDLMAGNPQETINTFAYHLDVPLKDVDLLLDLTEPNFEPYDAFAAGLSAALTRLGDLHELRNFALIATAIPETFSKVARGTDRITRHDWLFYKRLLETLPTTIRQPNFGDHTIVHPKFVAKDMRKIKAAGKVVYATKDAWVTRKGGAFRDKPEQMYDHCAEITVDTAFAYRGSTFSYGDDYIAKCATKAESSSTLSRWKDVGINHHITTVVDDLANLSGSPLQP